MKLFTKKKKNTAKSPKKKDLKCLSIDIGSSYIKFALGQRNGKKIKIEKTFKVKLPAEVYENGYIKNMDEIKSVIKKAISDNSSKIKQVICTIESTDAIKRELIVPAVDEDDLDEMVSYEIGQYLPIDINSYVLQYKIVNEFEEENVKKYELFVVALSKEIASSIYDMLKEVGLEPYAMDIHSNAVDKLSMSYEMYNGSSIKENTVAFLDMGYENINVIIIERSHYRFNRLIRSGAKDFALINKDALNIRNIDDIYQNLDIVENWIREIDKVFKYYTSRSTDNRIDKIFLYGGISSVAGLDTYISERVNIPVERIGTIGDVDIQSGNQDTLSHYLNAISSIIRV